MAVVTVNTPEPVVPPSTITVELTVEEAAYVAAVLGAGNEYETNRNARYSGPASEIYLKLHAAVVSLGGEALCERFDAGHRKWQEYRTSHL